MAIFLIKTKINGNFETYLFINKTINYLFYCSLWKFHQKKSFYSFENAVYANRKDHPKIPPIAFQFYIKITSIFELKKTDKNLKHNTTVYPRIMS